jgi:predicted DNA-binding WGR domain protein
MIELHPDKSAALAAFGKLALAKRRRGYAEAKPVRAS